MTAEQKLAFLSHVYVEGNLSFLNNCKQNPTDILGNLKPDDPVLNVYVFQGNSEDIEKNIPMECRMNNNLRQEYFKGNCTESFGIPVKNIQWNNFPESFLLTDCTIGNFSAFRTCCKWTGFVFHPKDEMKKPDINALKRDYVANMILESIILNISKDLLSSLRESSGIDAKDPELDPPIQEEMEMEV